MKQTDKLEHAEIDNELKRVKTRHPDLPSDMFQQLAIMQEEAGEVTKAVLHYHFENGTLDNVKNELIHTAAMCIRMLQNLQSMRPSREQRFAEWTSQHGFNFCAELLIDGKVKQWNKWYHNGNWKQNIGVTKWETTAELYNSPEFADWMKQFEK
jgi:NTP pyrophosphatase (non-canonical NTP hydrolase)